MVTIGLLHTGIRGDEKLLIAAAKKRKCKLELIDVRRCVFDPTDVSQYKKFDVMLERCVATKKGTHAIRFFEEIEKKVVNTFAVASVCEDKFATTTRLIADGVPTVEALLVFSEEQAKEAVERLGGYPVVVKSTEGSWGRLMGKVNDENALEAILEHKSTLGGPVHGAFYIQEYIEKGGRDIRAFVINGETICAIYRSSPHWITNTARGGKASNCPVTKELSDICKKASKAIGGGVLAMDLFETDGGLKVNEINHTMEFKNSEKPTGVSISGCIIDYCIQAAS